MFKKSSIPRKDVDFNVAQKKIIFAAAAHAAIWGIDANWLDSEVLPKQNDWLDAWAAYEDPDARTPNITASKTEKRKALEKVLRKLVKNLQGSVAVTPDDLREMGIVVPSSSRTPAQVAKDAPETEIDISVIGRVTVHFFEKGGSHKRAKPPGQHCAEIVWVLSDTPPTRWDELIHSNVDTHTPFTLVFEHDQRGRNVYFALRWENTRGEKGPWTDILTAMIP